MRVLVLCEYSGTVRDAFIAAGHDAWSCDLLPSEGKNLGQLYPQHYTPDHQLYNHQLHYQCDAHELFEGRVAHSMALEGQLSKWDLLIAHPPCQYLAKSGVCWLVKGTKGADGIDDVRWAKMDQAAKFFRWILKATPVARKAIENPMMHGYANRAIFGPNGRPPDQIVQPFHFGHPEWKTTCLWLENLPLLVPTDIVQPEERLCGGKRPGRITSRTHRMAPGPLRAKERAKFFPGMAAAMASQWGALSPPTGN